MTIISGYVIKTTYGKGEINHKHLIEYKTNKDNLLPDVEELAKECEIIEKKIKPSKIEKEIEEGLKNLIKKDFVRTIETTIGI